MYVKNLPKTYEIVRKMRALNVDEIDTWTDRQSKNNYSSEMEPKNFLKKKGFFINDVNS
jgi:hypothetical protein